MQHFMDHYSELGVTPQAEPEVIRAAYRVLAQRYHPDRQTGVSQASEDKMVRLNRAYSVLSQADSRRAYDLGRLEPQAAFESLHRNVNALYQTRRPVQPYLTTYDQRGRLHAYV
jgi:curved DNA-binding protein CbpA